MLKQIYKIHRHNLIFGHYPSRFLSAIIFLVVALTGASVGIDLTFGLDNYFHQTLYGEASEGRSLISFLLASASVWVGACTLRKFIVRRLLRYRGFLYDARKPSLKTKLVIASVRLLNGWFKPLTRNLYGLQGILPSLPVPSLQSSVKQYLDSMKPLVDADKHMVLERLANEFLQAHGPKFQRYLLFKSWISPNYISDWWEKYIYLMGRSSILINSNYYAFDALACGTPNQAARAALITYVALKLRKQIEENDLEPVIIQDVIPLCAWQYERMFNTCRIPGETIDSIQHEPFSDYVVVYHRGRYFRIGVYHANGVLLTEAEFQLQYDRILNDESAPASGEVKLGALTAWDRTNWAKTRSNFFAHGANKKSLDTIEKSAFVVVLDDEDFSTEFSEKDTTDLANFAQSLFHGKGYDRWCDKSVNFVVGKNGRAGGHIEHSWGDAPVGSHCWELCLRFSLDYDKYDDKGRIAAPVEKDPSYPERLAWQLPEECLEAIDKAAENAERMVDRVDLKILAFSTFGKGLMKKCKVSPDAFIQMALQLAYYRDQGHFDLTYEASMTRLYKQGRTETVRPCTTDSSDWVRSVENGLPKEDQIGYFHKACDQHQNSYRNAMSGKGFDRHLFGLYVVSKYLKIDSPFLNEALSTPWRLSTSQTSISQTKHAPIMCPGGGFGPVAEDGYGVSYIICGENLLFFHVTSSKASIKTDSTKFAEEIRRALNDIRELFSL